MNPLRSVLPRLAALAPAPIKRFIYSKPALLKPLAKLQALINETLRPGMVVADIGANLGFDTLHFSSVVGPTGHVHSFEPDPRNYEKLARNCALNKISNCTTHPEAVASSVGTIRMVLSGTVTSHLASPDDAAGTQIACVTLDASVERWPARRLDFVKIDVEGAEASVLEGSGAVLSTLRPVVAIEIHHFQALLDCCRLLLAQRYRIEFLTTTSYYRGAQAALAAGQMPAAEGFDIGHLAARPA